MLQSPDQKTKSPRRSSFECSGGIRAAWPVVGPFLLLLVAAALVLAAFAFFFILVWGLTQPVLALLVALALVILALAALTTPIRVLALTALSLAALLVVVAHLSSPTRPNAEVGSTCAFNIDENVRDAALVSSREC